MNKRLRTAIVEDSKETQNKKWIGLYKHHFSIDSEHQNTQNSSQIHNNHIRKPLELSEK